MDVKKIFESMYPFIFLGISIALCIGLALMFFWVAVWGLAIGGILWAAALAKNYFFKKVPPQTAGRIIEHEKDK